MSIENNFIGFSNNLEYLPKDFDEFNSIYRLRQLFLGLSNNILKSYCNFSKYEQRKLSIFPLNKAFSYKIKSMLPISFIKSKKATSMKFNPCSNSTNIINSYLNNGISGVISATNLIPVAKLISVCFVQNCFQLLIDKDLLFHEFVLDKIKKLHGNRKVIDLGDSIGIKVQNSIGIKVYTSWKHIETTKPNIKSELDNAIKSIKKGEFYQIYLAYPKNKQFTKHIPVYVDELKNREYQIKAIPYSFRSIIKN
ncbi:hypothetical protein [Aliarcobacter vitoriensis]|uniref:Uncharacterized protein n=1 Tax=Aliarcobacter vitoriensis TaxID=2011099 RepID=A0A366MRK8_9BACT|nr:hypothetical protein [Aliarcobacter vitoriensis]RBQ28119.1 hypothetical protein CRU91_10925 [Aliarcobacter vitoriensis]